MKKNKRNYAIHIFKNITFKEMNKEALELIYNLVKKRDKIFLDSVFGVTYNEDNIESLLKTILENLRRKS